MKSTIKYIIVSDCETGGLPGKDGKLAFYDVALAEIAAVVIDIEKMEIIEEWSRLIKPYKDGLVYSPKALEVNGLTMSQIENNGTEVQVVVEEFVNLLTKYKNPRIGAVLAGHNFLPFDIPFVQNMMEFCKKNLWDYVTFVEDTMKMAWYRATEQVNYKLGTCCQQEGVDLVAAHRALADTVANAQLLLKYISYLRGNGGEQETGKVQAPNHFRESFELV